MPSPNTDWALRLAAGLLALSVAGCNAYLERRETITSYAGDAVAANRAVHTIDPWPAGVADDSIPVSGSKLVGVIERYERRSSAPPAASTAAAAATGPAASVTP
jgi:hypothetical protein